MTSEVLLPVAKGGVEEAGLRMLSFVNGRVGGKLIEEKALLFPVVKHRIFNLEYYGLFSYMNTCRSVVILCIIKPKPKR